ncbi:hypothetical protein Ancab_025262 [Ancistrocladus abbreviatus]
MGTCDDFTNAIINQEDFLLMQLKENRQFLRYLLTTASGYLISFLAKLHHVGFTILHECSFQVYAEAYTCPCIRCHPSEPFFVVQSNGNYIAIVSTKHPYRLDKYKRYESHGVSGFPIKCEFSVDGEALATGSSDGYMYFYSVQSSHLIKKIKACDQACVDVAFHPLLPNVIASCSWNGDITVFE